MRLSPTTTRSRTTPSTVWPVAVLLILLSAHTFSQQGSAQEDEELFREAFGDKEENSPRSLPLAIYMGNRYIGEVDAQVESQDEVKIDIEAFLSLFREYMQPDLVDSLEALSEEEFLSPETISESGIDVEFRREHLELYVEIPPELRRTRETSLQSRRRIPDTLSPGASAFSAYMNIELESQLIYDKRGEETDLLYPFFAAIQPNLQLFSWVLENRTTYDYDMGTGTPLELDYLRLVKDFPEPALRLSAGTISSPVEGFLGSFDMTGVSISSHKALRRAYEGEGVFAQEIIIEEPAELVVYINGRVIKRTRVEPGPHRLLDFPFASGLNTVRIELVREDGTVELLRESVPFDSKLLEPEELSFSAGAGTLREDMTTPAASGFFSYGFGEMTTAGLFFQSDAENHIAGTEFIQATRIGNFSATTGFSYAEARDFGYAGRLRYRLSLPRREYFPSFSASAHYTGPSFISNISTLTEDTENTSAWQLSAQVGQSLPLDAHASLFLGHTIGRSGSPDTSSGSLSLLKSIGNSASLSVHYSHTYNSRGDTEWRAGLYVSVYPESSEGSSSTVMYGQNLKTGEGRTSYSSSGENSYYSLGLKGFPPEPYKRSTTAQGVYRYTHDKFQGSIRNSYSVGRDGDTEERTLRNSSTMSLSTALLYTEGIFGLSKPLRDSFIFVVPEGPLKEETLSVRAADGSGSAQETVGRPIVLNDLQSYSPVALFLDTPTSPPETGLLEERVQLLPSYKSGNVIRPRMRETVSVRGTLLTLDDEPIPFQAGEIRAVEPKEGQQDESFLFFTNEEGDFQLYDIEPGEYKLLLYADKMASTQFTVPEDAESPYRLEETVLPVVLKQNTLEAK